MAIPPGFLAPHAYPVHERRSSLVLSQEMGVRRGRASALERQGKPSRVALTLGNKMKCPSSRVGLHKELARDEEIGRCSIAGDRYLIERGNP